MGRAHQAQKERLYRSLLVSNLITIHLKSGIGKLSAYCGVVSAGCGAACGICYQDGGDLCAVSHTLVNAIAMISGTVCDGAKPSCAAKIASAVEAGLLGYEMYRHGQQFRDGEGIVSKGVENTIHNIALLARKGMQETDRRSSIS
ncbi:MAG: L-serine ammonia-lyase, iron-sulfur-dependent, subunit alpha [Merdibacter sp.]